ncbi:MAG: hypothetical protein DRP74_06770 [Candidatus Omnitrophota bacterium]|nr:MAG: hypothetical protein DRP74_06770 [Candidatus Omnitrophota bacterium]
MDLVLALKTNNKEKNTKKNQTLILFHYTEYDVAQKIKEEGLRGGHGTHGGLPQEYTEVPTLYLATTILPDSDAERYGNYPLIVEISEDKLRELGGIYYDWANVWILKGEGILIPPEYIRDPNEEFKEGICEPTSWCKAYCPMYEECELVKEERIKEGEYY